MLYRKNVGRIEALLRFGGGAGMIAAAIGWAGIATPAGLALAAGGAVAVLTSVFGYCPACAMVGRKAVG